MRKHLALAMAVIFSLPMMAGDEVKSLPPAMYDSMKSGKKLDKVFVDPAYDRTKGFKLGTVDFRAEFRSTKLIENLPKALGSIQKGSSDCTLNVTVVKAAPQKMAFPMGVHKAKLTVEGQVVDRNGKVLVAFVADEKCPTNDFEFAGGCDLIAAAILADLQ